jgi:hypothetical protein
VVVRLRRTVGPVAVLLALAVGGSGCTGSTSAGPSAAEIRAYVSAVEPVRLGVNQLLTTADPILNAFHAQSITPSVASQRMDGLEKRFAGYLLTMAEIDPSNPVLRALNGPYAHTYYLEDDYLSTLAADLAGGSFDNLPNTQNAQRLAIIEWRTQLELVARRAGVRLPADLQQAGRGEIAPSATGS